MTSKKIVAFPSSSAGVISSRSSKAIYVIERSETRPDGATVLSRMKHRATRGTSGVISWMRCLSGTNKTRVLITTHWPYPNKMLNVYKRCLTMPWLVSASWSSYEGDGKCLTALHQKSVKYSNPSTKAHVPVLVQLKERQRNSGVWLKPTGSSNNTLDKNKMNLPA